MDMSSILGRSLAGLAVRLAGAALAVIAARSVWDTIGPPLAAVSRALTH